MGGYTIHYAPVFGPPGHAGNTVLCRHTELSPVHPPSSQQPGAARVDVDTKHQKTFNPKYQAYELYNPILSSPSQQNFKQNHELCNVYVSEYVESREGTHLKRRVVSSEDWTDLFTGIGRYFCIWCRYA